MNVATGFLTSFCREAISWLYPAKCPLCGRVGELSPCDECASLMAPANPDMLREHEGPLDFRACAYAYEGRAAQAVRKLKYSRCTSLVPFMAQATSQRLADLATPDDLIVPVPMNWARQSWRGFNQSLLLCGNMSGHPIRPDLLRRVRNTRPQAGLSLRERQENLKGAFSASRDVEGQSVILVDDVVTSGQTARECARALREAGAVSVGIVAFAGNLE